MTKSSSYEGERLIDGKTLLESNLPFRRRVHYLILNDRLEVPRYYKAKLPQKGKPIRNVHAGCHQHHKQ